VVVVGGQDNYGLPGFFKAFSTDGQFLWQIDLPGEPYPGIFEFPFARGRFSPDGTTVYMGTTISGLPPDNLRCKLYALQTAEPRTCSNSINPLSKSFTSRGGEGGVNVVAPNGCTWTATSNANWITFTSDTSGTGNGIVTYLVRDNFATTPRTATLTIAGQTLTVYQGLEFADVPQSHPFYTEIGKLSARGVTLGCGGGNYCPDDVVTRDQMAAFIIRALGDFNPPIPAQQRFADVLPSNPFYAFIEQLAVRQITLGCGGGDYCPDDPVLRDQMAAFIIRALHPPGYIPPAPAMQRFPDVPPANSFYAFIEEMAVRQITLGCGGRNYCPTQSVTRAQMAAFLVRAFNL
jgi:hypothetical protein